LFPYVTEQHVIAQSPELRKMVVYGRSCFCHTLSFAAVSFAMSLIIGITHARAETAGSSGTMRTLG
jgi:hypothetical protein